MKMRMVALASCMAVITGAAVLHCVAQDDAGVDKALEQQLKALLKTRWESADQAYAAVAAGYDAQTVTIFTLLDANQALAEAEMEQATKPAEQTAALQKNVERLRGYESKVKDRWDHGFVGADALTYYSVKRDRETAQIALARVRLQAKPSGN